MPSPFPGMDPYLEDPTLWRDLHQRLITYIADALQPQVRPRYRAQIEERLYVVQSRRSIYPDVRVIQHTLRESAVAEIGHRFKTRFLGKRSVYTFLATLLQIEYQNAQKWLL